MGPRPQGNDCPPVRLRRHRRRLAAALMPFVLGACATTGATVGSGVGDAFLRRAPYYAGADAPAAGNAAVVGHLPVVYQRGATQAPIFDPSGSDAMAALLADMNAYLDSLQVTARLVEGGRVSAVTHAATLRPPDVQFGCVTPSGVPDDDCAVDGDTVLGRDALRMRLAVGRPSPEWIAWMGDVTATVGVEQVLVITLEVGQYLVRQRGLLGRKEVELGTAHVADLPWLTSLETPVAVLQLTGALVGRDGRAIRIGAEGLVARRTGFRLSAVGAQELITDEDVDRLRTARRESVAGAPLVWQVGLRTLVGSLLAGGRAP
jgi:hypothetical protein